MSNLPPPANDPLSYYAPYPQPSRRPLSVSIIGWLVTVFAAIGVLDSIWLIIQNQFPPVSQPTNPIMDVLNTPGPIRNYMTIVQILSSIENVLLLIAGIGCLKLKQFARRLLIGISIYQLASGVVGIIMNMAWINPAVGRAAAQHPNDPALQMMYHGSMIMEGVGFLVGMSATLVILYFLTRPHVKTAFNPSPPPLISQ